MRTTLAVGALVLDYDGEGTTIQQILDAIEGRCALIYSTSSHLQDGCGECYRVIMPYSRPVTADEHREIASTVVSYLASLGHKLDSKAVQNPCGVWYFPTLAGEDAPFVYRELHGEPLDADALLAYAHPHQPASQQGATPSTPPSTSSSGSTQRPARRARREVAVTDGGVVTGPWDPALDRRMTACLRHIAEAPLGERHHTLLRQGRAIGGMVGAELVEEALSLIGASILTGWGVPPSTKDLATARDAVLFGAMEPITPSTSTSSAQEDEDEEEDGEEGVATGEEEDGGDWRDRVPGRRVSRSGKIMYPMTARTVAFAIEHGLHDMLRYDADRCTLVVRIPSGAWVPYYDGALALRIAVEDALGFLPSEHMCDEAVRSLRASGLIRTMSPLADWLRSLVWDGVPRLDTLLIRLLGAPDTALVRAMTSRHIIGAARRALTPGCQHDTVLILQGGQGLGKSTFISSLHGEEHYASGALLASSDSRDTLLQVSSVWGIELAELSGMRRAELERVKAFITTRSDLFREPYARAATQHPRRCVFWGTTNDTRPLPDDEENRRWWIVPVTRAMTQEDREWLSAMRSQIWAEAVHRAMSGESSFLSREEADLFEAHRASTEAATYRDEDVRELVALALERWHTTALIRTRDLLALQELRSIGGHRERRISQALRSLGFQQVNRRVDGVRARFWVPVAPGMDATQTTLEDHVVAVVSQRGESICVDDIADIVEIDQPLPQHMEGIQRAVYTLSTHPSWVLNEGILEYRTS